ncbi:hypothetical protein D3C81_1469970 [compost metagenome]
MSFWLLTISEVQPVGLLRKRPRLGSSGSRNTSLYFARSATDFSSGAKGLMPRSGSPLITYSGTHQPSVAPLTVSPRPNTLPSAAALTQAGLRPAHSSPMTWMSFLASAASRLTVLPGSVSVG